MPTKAWQLHAVSPRHLNKVMISLELGQVATEIAELAGTWRIIKMTNNKTGTTVSIVKQLAASTCRNRSEPRSER